MDPSRRSLLLGAAAAAGCGVGRPAVDEPLRRAHDWLWSQQAEDGGFHGTKYGLFRGGDSLTGLALLALLPCSARPGGPEARRAEAAAALSFLAARAGPSGALGLLDVPDYPIYATSLAVRAICLARPRGYEAVVAPMVTFLLDQQLRGDAWADHPARGGFPMGSSTRRSPPDAGHVDLSMTRRAAQALAASGLSPDHPALVEARAYALRARDPTGRFVYSPNEPALDKGVAPDRGYGTPTTDGVLCLLATGGAADAVAAGLAALHADFRVDENPGIGEGALRAYARAMRFDWRAGVAEVFGQLGGPAGWREALRAALLAEQRSDGSFANELAQQKEDEPVIATAFALIALAA